MPGFLLTFNHLLVFLIFFLCGYVFKKKKLINDALGGVISKLEVYVFLPALSFSTFADNFHLNVLREKGVFLATGTIILGVSFSSALFLSKLFSKNSKTRNVFIYAFTAPNYGYLGYPLIRAVYGEEALFNFMIFAVPYNIFTYTAGRYILSADKRLTARNLLEPSLIGVFAGIAAGLADVPLPVFFGRALTLASGCMAPMAMIMTGFVLANNPLASNITSPKIYLASALRLVIIPAIIGGALLLLGLRRDVVLLTGAFLCLPMGLNNVVFPEAYGGDSTTGAQCCFVSHTLGILTIPAMFALLSLFKSPV
jgi:predicted permease